MKQLAAGNNLKHKDKIRRKLNYDRLRAAGFNSREANRMKDFSNYKIDQLIKDRLVYNAETDVFIGQRNLNL